jgi:hypothetical protein
VGARVGQRLDDLPVGQVQLGRTLGLGAGEPDQRPPAGQALGAMPGGGIGQVDAAVALPLLRPSRYQPGTTTSRGSLPSTRMVTAPLLGRGSVVDLR